MGQNDVNQQSTTETTLVSYSNYVPPRDLSPWKFQYYGPDAKIQDFDPSNLPILHDVPPNNNNKAIKVRLFTEVFNGKTIPWNECKHILHDGLSHSQVFDLVGTTYTDKNVVKAGEDVQESWKMDELWVLDAHHLVDGTSCTFLEKAVQKTLALRGNISWPILAVDYGDDNKLVHCEALGQMVGPNFYRVAKRSITVGREWNDEVQFPKRGTLSDLTYATTDNDEQHVLHLPYPVRTDVAQGIAQQVLQLEEKNDHGIPKTPWQQKNRDIHVSHFYKRQIEQSKGSYFDNLRNGVNAVLTFLNGMPLPGDDQTTLQSFAGLAGADKRMGRNKASDDYVKTMLRSQIIVVAQRDAWSDHYRLMEALSSGAMVICDETLVLPKGLRHGESVVVFTSLSELREEIFYYLAHEQERLEIAKRGWELAMGYHRSWHAMETVVFGQPITNSGDPMAALKSDMAEKE